MTQFICAQPATSYFAWQCEVMLENFKQINLADRHDIHLVFAYNSKLTDYLEHLEPVKKLEEKYENVARFFYYEDTRESHWYPSSVRPHILAKHFREYSHLANNPIFYHDCDIIFTKFPNFLFDMSHDDMNWYVSNTVDYIGYNYIVSKGQEVLDLMCDIVGINPKLVQEKQNESGGAQYLLKGVDWRFWDKVEHDSEKMFVQLKEQEERIKIDNPEYHEVQRWCADMWSVLWNGWLRGFTTNVDTRLKFIWATDPVIKWGTSYIYHNAGVVKSGEGLFFKGDFSLNGDYPYGKIDLESLDKNISSYKYAKAVEAAGLNSCLI